MRREIREGEMIPPFYGIGYRDYSTDRKFCYPLFINLLVILWVDFKRWLKNPKNGNV